MDAQTWSRAKDLIAGALELPADAREAFLDAHCPDGALREEVRSLPAVATPSNRRESSSFRRDDGDPAALDHDLVPGARIGHYTILGNLGTGGMGHVLLCEDIDLHRKVALKSLLTSVDGTERARAQHQAGSRRGGPDQPPERRDRV